MKGSDRAFSLVWAVGAVVLGVLYWVDGQQTQVAAFALGAMAISLLYDILGWVRP